MSDRSYFVVIGATFFALFTPHPNISHLGYCPIGVTLLFISSGNPDWRSLLMLIATYLVGWVICALGIFLFCRSKGI